MTNDKPLTLAEASDMLSNAIRSLQVTTAEEAMKALNKFFKIKSMPPEGALSICESSGGELSLSEEKEGKMRK